MCGGIGGDAGRCGDIKVCSHINEAQDALTDQVVALRESEMYEKAQIFFDEMLNMSPRMVESSCSWDTFGELLLVQCVRQLIGSDPISTLTQEECHCVCSDFKASLVNGFCLFTTWDLKYRINDIESELRGIPVAPKCMQSHFKKWMCQVAEQKIAEREEKKGKKEREEEKRRQPRRRNPANPNRNT